MTCSVVLHYEDTVKTVSAESGQTLYSVLSENGVPFAAPCGGNGRCGKCRVSVSGNIKADADGTCLACKTAVEGDCEVFIGQKAASVLTSGNKAAYETDGEDSLFLAVDIGTTTVAAYLMNGKDGSEKGHFSLLNPQRVHGADVISRLEFAIKSKENSALMMREIDDAITEGLNKLLCNSGLDVSQVERTYVGNTVMMHIAAGYDAESLSKAPFVPLYTSAHRKTINSCAVRFGGCISGYVGADTVAAALACDIDKTEKTVLLIDIGTNGEIVLKHDGKMFWGVGLNQDIIKASVAALVSAVNKVL